MTEITSFLAGVGTTTARSSNSSAGSNGHVTRKSKDKPITKGGKSKPNKPTKPTNLNAFLDDVSDEDTSGYIPMNDTRRLQAAKKQDFQLKDRRGGLGRQAPGGLHSEKLV